MEVQCDMPHDELSQLPDAVLVIILQHLPLRERLSCCALVSKSWAAAAVLTTAELAADLSSCIRWEHVQDWLHQHATQVCSIRFSHHGQRKQLLQLPCSRLTKLTHLYVDSMTVRLLEVPEYSRRSTCLTESDCSPYSSGGAGTSPHMAESTTGNEVAAAVGAPASASSCSMAGSMGGMADLTAVVTLLPQLQHLKLFSCSIALEHLTHFSTVIRLTSLYFFNSTVTQDTISLAPAAEEDLTAAMSDVLQGLTSLIDLNMGLMGMLSPLALTSISSMQRLQRLQLYISTGNEHADSFLASLPASLTAVALQNICLTPSAAVARQLSRLSQLQQLELTDLDLDSMLLTSWTALTSLTLDAVYLATPCFQASTFSASISTVATQLSTWDFDSGAQSLFTALRQLPQLQNLELSRMQLDEVLDSQQLSALTASSALTSLHLLARFCMPIPQGALQHVLPPAVFLTQLLVLRLQGGDGVSQEQCLNSADVARIAASCPGLTELTLKGVITLGASLAPLLKLQGTLLRLSVAGAAFGDAASALVAQLTGLQSLEWSDCSSLTDVGLVRLSALKGLQRLYLKSCKGLSQAVLPPDTWYTASKLLLESKAPQPEPSDVWRQLLQLCEAAHAQQSVT